MGCATRAHPRRYSSIRVAAAGSAAEGSARDAHVRLWSPIAFDRLGVTGQTLVTGHFQRLVLGRYGGTPLLALTRLPIRGSAVSHVRRLVDRRVIRAETASSPSRTATATSPCPR